MSALPPKADIGTRSRNVRFVPEADVTPPAIRSPPRRGDGTEAPSVCAALADGEFEPLGLLHSRVISLIAGRIKAYVSGVGASQAPGVSHRRFLVQVLLAVRVSTRTGARS